MDDISEKFNKKLYVSSDFRTTEQQEELYRELLVLDLYLRERVKSRPTFAGAYTVSKDVKRQQGKMSHVEEFHYDVIGDCKERNCVLLFDYENKSKLTHEAAVVYL